MPEVTLSFDLDYRVICVKLERDLSQVAAHDEWSWEIKGMQAALELLS